MAEIEKLSIEEIGERVSVIGMLIDMSIDRLSADDFTESNLTDRELKALLMGELFALVYVHDCYLGGLDDTSPEMVAKVRSDPAPDATTRLIRTTVKTYHHLLFAEEGDEQ